MEKFILKNKPQNKCAVISVDSLDLNYPQSFKGKYIFYFLSFENILNKTENFSWKAYDLLNQKHLNNFYQNYLDDPSRFCLLLLSPLNQYGINFKKMVQFYRFDNSITTQILIQVNKNFIHYNKFLFFS